MYLVSGEILTEVGFKSGYIAFEKGKIVETGKGNPPKKPICKGLIIPTFVNAHTHIGDSFIRKRGVELPRDVERLVAPHHGLKHQLLSSASDTQIIEGMKDSIEEMIRSGTSIFCDFREGGTEGISLLNSALKNQKISSLILSRPRRLEYNHNEIKILLQQSHGIGLSSISDWELSKLEKVAKDTKRSGKIFAIHASEITREDIDVILNLKPDFLIHMLKATESDLIRVRENNIPVVLCPRSNAFYGLKPNIKLMKNLGVEILFGTDNAMLNSPFILNEIRYIKATFKMFSIQELLYIATFGARKALNLDCDILGPNSKADFVVLNKKSLEPLYV